LTKYHIRYVPLSGGKFLAQLLTVGLDNLGKEYFDLYDRNDLPWMERENKFFYHKNIDLDCTHNFTFREIAGLENLVFINTMHDESIAKIEFRNQYVSNSMNNSMVKKLKIKYSNECYEFLKSNNVDFFNFDHRDFWNGEQFLLSMNNLGKYLNIQFDTEVLKYAHRKWVKSNIQYNREIEQQKST
jgi:hypothetical protein